MTATGRPSRRAAGLLIATGGGASWWSAQQTWDVRTSESALLGPVQRAIPGRELVGLAPALAIAILVAALVLLLLGGWFRRVIAALVLGLAIAAGVVTALALGRAQTQGWWPWVCLAGSVLAAVGGAGALAPPRPRSVDAGTARTPADSGDLWEAVSAGRDLPPSPASGLAE